MSENFLNYLYTENFDFTSADLLTFVNWTDEEKKIYNYPSALNINSNDFDLLDTSIPANEIISKLYFEDNELLFLIIYTQRIIYLSTLNEVFTYNSDLENPDFEYDPNIHEHMYLTDVDVFMIRTKNKIYIFGLSSDSYYDFEEVIISANGNNIDSPLAIKTFDRLGIKYKRNFQTLIKLIESHYK